MVADDESGVLNILRLFLEEIGFRVITAENGEQMVASFMEYAEDIALLLMDINMPQLNGEETALQIRKINPNVPILFMSGYARERVIGRFKDQPHVGFVRKPFQRKTLIVAIHNALNP